MDSRKAGMLRRAEAALALSDATIMQRLAAGLPPMPVTVCIGGGRCLIPGAETTPHTCPFCVRVSLAAGERPTAEALVNRVFTGN